MSTTTTQSRGAFPNGRITLIILSILTLPYILGLLVAIFFAFVSPLVFDPPGSTKDPLVWAEFLVYCTCPLTFIIGIAGGWLSFFLNRHRLALVLAILPILETTLLVIAGAVFEGLF